MNPRGMLVPVGADVQRGLVGIWIGGGGNPLAGVVQVKGLAQVAWLP